MLASPVRDTPYDLKFRLLGIAARIHPSFWIGAFLFAADAGRLSFILASILTLFVSIFVHEMGHALAGRHFGDRSPSIMLYIFGGFYEPGDMRLRHGRQIWMCLWGPLAGFILGGIAAAAWYAQTRGWIPPNDLVYFIIWDAMWINIAWGLINLLPVFPLDGGRILFEIVSWKYPQKETVFCFTFSLLAAIAVTALSLTAHLLFHIGIFPTLLFATLGVQNFLWRRQTTQMGGMSFQEDEPREAWQQDPDWWKKK